MFYVILLLLLCVISTSSYSFLSDGNDYVSCILNNGKVTCMGKNYKGLLGIGETDENVVKNRPQTVIASGATDLACAGLNACFLIENGKLKAWGSGTDYILGLGWSTANKYSPTQLGTNWDAVQCGYNFCAARKTNGDLYAWGKNTYKVISGSTGDRADPFKIRSGVSDYTVSQRSIVVRATDNKVYGIGFDEESGKQLGSSSYSSTWQDLSNANKASECTSFYRVPGGGNKRNTYCKASSHQNKVISWGSTISNPDLLLHGASPNGYYTNRYMQYTNNKASSGEQSDWKTVKQIAYAEQSIYILDNNGKIYFGGNPTSSKTATESYSWSSINAAVEMSAWGSDNAAIGRAGSYGIVVLKSNGDMKVIGLNTNGKLGTGDDVTDNTLPFSIKEYNPPPVCNENYYGNSGTCTACAPAYRRPAGDLESCTTCSCTKLPNCSLNEYANGNGCTACGANALNAAGDDPATVTKCTCPLNYFGNNGACTKCDSSSLGFTLISDGSAPTVTATRAQCETYASQQPTLTFQGDVNSFLQSSQPKGCIVVSNSGVFWNPSTTSTITCDSTNQCVDTITNTYVGTRLAGDDQSCTTCSCDAPCGIGNYGDNYGCSACAANTQAKAAGDLQSCTTCTCLCTADHYGNNGSCTACANGYENAAGDSQLCTTCACSAKPPCAAGQYGNGNGCTACPANTMPKDAGDSQDCTVCSCQCKKNYFGFNGACNQCSTGYIRPEGDDMQCTNCGCFTCDANYFGDSGSCHMCPGNTIDKAAGDSVHCTDCSCQCKENFYGNFGVCTACPSNSSNAAGDSHGCQNCSCTCDVNHYGVNNSCVACPSGFTNPAGDLPSCQNCSCTSPPPLPPTTPSTGTNRFVLHKFVVWILGMVVVFVI